MGGSLFRGEKVSVKKWTRTSSWRALSSKSESPIVVWRFAEMIERKLSFGRTDMTELFTWVWEKN